MTDKTIIRLSATPGGFGQKADKLDPDMFVSDLPVQHSHEYYQDENLGLYVGVWDTTDMVEAAGPYACDEFMWLLEGEAQIKNCKTGETEKVIAGEPFVIPKGYDCQWHQVGYLRKFFLISENPNEAVPNEPAVEGVIIPRIDVPTKPLLSGEPFLTEHDSPTPHHHISYRDHTGKFLSGTWESDPFESVTRPFPYHGLAQVVAGSLTLIDESGTSHQFTQGQTFFVPEGVLCSASANVAVKLIFSILKT
jgi:uncharacterized cupin superfamily protein